VIHATIIAPPADRKRALIPLRDANPGLGRPLVTLAIIALCTYVLLVIQLGDPQPDRVLYELATIPCEVITGDALDQIEIQRGVCSGEPARPVFPEKSVPASLLASLFMHGILIHLISNMWSLWIFGNNVEDAFGRLGYIVFYVGGGLVASGAHVALNPSSVIPIVGASGAIAAVMGAYLVLYPTSRIVSIIPPFFFFPIAVRAWFFLGVWFLGQFAFAGQLTAVAWEAHVGGFLFGVAAAFVLRNALRRRVQRRLRRARASRFSNPG
jgi:membrane associated rhomboid family serine protease